MEIEKSCKTCALSCLNNGTGDICCEPCTCYSSWTPIIKNEVSLTKLSETYRTQWKDKSAYITVEGDFVKVVYNKTLVQDLTLSDWQFMEIIARQVQRLMEGIDETF